jgi:DNA-binding transcriptional MerR regulator
MRMSELAECSGVSVATIKFYLREGLLAPGTPVSKTQSEYGETHLERLRLIRALRDVANLPIAAIKSVLTAVDDEETTLTQLLGTTQLAVAGGSTQTSAEGAAAANALLGDIGWALAPDSPLIGSLARVLDVMRAEDLPTDAQTLTPWIAAARQVAEVEVGMIPLNAPRSEAAHIVAVGTVVFGELLTQLRLVAQEAVSLQRFSQ